MSVRSIIVLSQRDKCGTIMLTKIAKEKEPKPLSHKGFSS